MTLLRTVSVASAVVTAAVVTKRASDAFMLAGLRGLPITERNTFHDTLPVEETVRVLAVNPYGSPWNLTPAEAHALAPEVPTPRSAENETAVPAKVKSARK